MSTLFMNTVEIGWHSSTSKFTEHKRLSFLKRTFQFGHFRSKDMMKKLFSRYRVILEMLPKWQWECVRREFHCVFLETKGLALFSSRQ